jgi:hypothetical protein
MDDPLRRVRGWTVFFIAALVVSGITALPIRTELEWAAAVLGEDLGASHLPGFMTPWLSSLRGGIRLTSDRAPFIFYGTDWLAFGHFAIALAFVGAVRDPVRNRWLYQFGMIACAAVPVWAFVFGPIRGVPPWWRLVDASFGIVGLVPLWLCDRTTRRIEAGSARSQ